MSQTLVLSIIDADEKNYAGKETMTVHFAKEMYDIDRIDAF